MYYSRVKQRNLKKQEKFKVLLSLVMAGIAFSASTQAVNTESYVTSLKQTNQSGAKNQIAHLKAPTQLTADTVSFVANEITALTVVSETETTTYVESVIGVPQSVDYTNSVEATSTYQYQANYAHQEPTASNSNYPVTLANGNTAGAIGSEAAAQMAAATGVPQETWEYIIARESNGNPNVANASGASGLFQTMPGWGSTSTVQDQINSALNAYNSQGLAAWGMQ